MKTLVASLIFTLCAFSLMAQTPVSLKLNLEKGKTYTIKTTGKQAIKQTVNGQDYAVEVNSNSVLTYKVIQQVNEMMDIEFKFDTISIKISSPMFNKETNSAKSGSSDPLEIIMNKLSTYKLIAKISTAGKFIGFVNYGHYKDSVMYVLDSIPATKRDDAKKQADGLLKESALQSMIEPFFAYLPEKAVIAGDTWESSFFNTTGELSLLSANSYALKSIDNKLATISGTTEIEAMPSTDSNAQMTQELKGNATFDGTIDLKTGLALKNTSTIHCEGTTTVKNNGNEMKMPMKLDGQTVTVMTK